MSDGQTELETLRLEVAELKQELSGWNPDETMAYSWSFSRHLRPDSRYYVYDTKTKTAVEYYGDSYHAKAEAKRLNDIESNKVRMQNE